MIAVLLGVLTVIGTAAVALADSGLPAPVITVKPSNPTNSQVGAFTYTDSVSVSFQCSLDGAAFVACGSGTSGSKSYPGSQTAGSHTFQVKAVSGSKSSTTSYTWLIDLTAPSVVSINRVGSSPTNAASAQWTVTFSEAVKGVDASDFTLVNGGLAGSPAITSVTPSVSTSATAFTVTASAGIGSGTLGVNLVDNDSILDQASNKLGGTGAGNGNATGQVYTIDRSAPSVVSINRAGASPTSASSVQWTVVFSESVSGVDSGDFALANTGLSSPSITGVSGSGSTYMVNASTSSGSGSLGLNLVDDDSITDAASNKLGGTGAGNGSFAGQVYAVDRTPPTVTSINRGTSSPTNAASVQWTVIFSETVTGVDSADFSLAKTGLGGTPAITGVSGTGSSRTVTASTGSGSGTLGLNLVDNDSILDALGNKLGGTGSGNGNFTGQVYSIDRSAPTVVSVNRAGLSPTNASSVQWSVSFSEPVTGVSPSGGNFSLVAVGLTGPVAISGASGSGGSYAVSATTGTGTSGSTNTLQLKAANAGAIVDAAGNALTGLPFNGQTYVIDKTAPNAPNLTFAPFPWPPLGWQSTTAPFSFESSSSDVASYLCKLDTGPFAACSSPKSYAGLAQGQHTFEVKAVDAAGNVSSATSRTFFVDTVSPTEPVFTQKPPDPSSTATSTFAWTSTDPPPASGIAGYLCSKENGSWFPCSSPYTYVVETTSNGQHQFAVVAVDWAGNISDQAKYNWKVAAGTPADFTISGSVTGLQIGIWKSIPITISNSNNAVITVTSLTVVVSGNPNGCSATANFETQPSAVPFTVPANAVNYPVPAANQPQIRLANLPSNQDHCKSQTISLSFNGSANGP